MPTRTVTLPLSFPHFLTAAHINILAQIGAFADPKETGGVEVGLC
jgi:hypothetical protein